MICTPLSDSMTGETSPICHSDGNMHSTRVRQTHPLSLPPTEHAADVACVSAGVHARVHACVCVCAAHHRCQSSLFEGWLHFALRRREEEEQEEQEEERRYLRSKTAMKSSSLHGVT